MPGTFTYAEATNTVTVTGGTSGSPADFASFVTADRAGTGTDLLAAWAPISNTKALTYQVRPVELLALFITFTVAAKTAEADFIFITGTDAWDAAQTESLDVTAGNGAYVTTKRFKTITNIDCSDNAAGGGTVWANGTIKVEQPIWGVIWNKGGKQFQCDSLFTVGNGSTATYFVTKGEQITIHSSISAWLNINGAYFVSGELVDETDKTTQNGSGFIFLRSDGGTSQMATVGGGVCYLYSTHILGNFSNTTTAQLLSAMSRMWNCIFAKDVTPQTTANVACDIYNINTQKTCFGFRTTNAALTFLNIIATDCTYGIYTYGGGVAIFKNCTLTNSVTANIRTFGLTANKYFVDCILDNWSFSNAGGSHTAIIYRQNTFNLHVTDIAGDAIDGATVTLKDNNDLEIFSISTDVNGDIAEQTVTRGTYIPISPYTFTDYSPHTLTVTSGALSYQQVITIDRAMNLEVALTAGGGGTRFIRIPICSPCGPVQIS